MDGRSRTVSEVNKVFKPYHQIMVSGHSWGQRDIVVRCDAGRRLDIEPIGSKGASDPVFVFGKQDPDYKSAKKLCELRKYQIQLKPVE